MNVPLSDLSQSSVVFPHSPEKNKPEENSILGDTKLAASAAENSEQNGFEVRPHSFEINY